MSEPRPILKLKLSSIPSPISNAAPTPSTSTPKLKLKFGPTPSQPPTEPAVKLKPPRKPKKQRPPVISTGKTSKKRDFKTHSEDDDLDTVVVRNATTADQPKIKKIKLNTRQTPTTPFIRVKAKGKPPQRPLGVGYDSEASDREEDPAIEEEFILRMQPGEDCDYLRKAVAERRFGPRAEGGADVRMKFLTRDGRRAIISIKGRHYAACLVDLPCVIEAMKSWDKRGWWKSADVCQMLIVLGRIDREQQAMEFPLPDKELDSTTWQYAHGLTPPMRWVRRRRFRKRISNKTIEAVEDEVERLLQADDVCESSSYTLVDLERQRREEERQRLASEEEATYNAGNYETETGSVSGEDDEGYFQTQEGEADGEADADGEEDDADDFAAQLEMDFAQAAGEAGDGLVPTSILDSPAAVVAAGENSEVSTPAVGTPAGNADDEDGTSDEDEGEEEEEVDEDVLEQQADLARQREEMADLEAAIQSQTSELDKHSNPILREKLVKKIRGLKSDLEVKKAAIGEGAEG
ncbi:hypothetical protein MMC25_005027 [Agyrium rufum]|nr:hypothetical protein [Agyrium rufum]